jgi:hypothetical protein
MSTSESDPILTTDSDSDKSSFSSYSSDDLSSSENQSQNETYSDFSEDSQTLYMLTDDSPYNYSNSSSGLFENKRVYTGNKCFPKFSENQNCSFYFQKVFPDSFFRRIVKNTNAYGNKKKEFKEVTFEELKTFLSITMTMSFVKLPRIEYYWSNQYSWSKQESISSLMSRNRYFEILTNLSLTSRRKHGNKLYKVQPLIDHLKSVFKNLCYFGQNLSIDESMIKFKGRSSMKQYIPTKPIPRGYKVNLNFNTPNFNKLKSII